MLHYTTLDASHQRLEQRGKESSDAWLIGWQGVECLEGSLTKEVPLTSHPELFFQPYR